jgi:hypothetical protein
VQSSTKSQPPRLDHLVMAALGKMLAVNLLHPMPAPTRRSFGRRRCSRCGGTSARSTTCSSRPSTAASSPPS